MTALNLLILCLSLPVWIGCGYLLLLTLLSRRSPAPAASRRCLRFDVLIPAHDEAAGIAATVRSLRALDWPQRRFRVIVIADNCQDETADRARAAGAEVWERRDPQRLGKGYALQYGFQRSMAEAYADAVAVVDADSLASPNLLEAFAVRLEAGADAVQAHYGVANPDASWRTRLMAIALAAIHKLRSRARARLGLSCGLRGNGWCVTRSTLRRCPYDAFSLAEDVEYGVSLGLSALSVRYADEAEVLGEMSSGERHSRSQRQRWESGRRTLARQCSPRLLRLAIKRRDADCLDLALDLLVPPLSTLALCAGATTAVAAAAAGLGASPLWLWTNSASMLALLAYVARGWALSGTGRAGLLDLARAPAFVAWKLALRLRQAAPQQWVRTGRESA